MDSIKCTRCKVSQEKDQFISIRGLTTKTCAVCRVKAKAESERNKCEHNRKKAHCRECGGSQICEHKKYKVQCKECGGSQICKHNKVISGCKDCNGSSFCDHEIQRSRCKKCKGGGVCSHNKRRTDCKECSSDPLKLTITTMIRHSKEKDKGKKRYDADNFIDKCFLEGLFEDQTFDEVLQCHYCERTIQYMKKGDDMCTIERLDNAIGHIKSNTVLACWHCNARHNVSKH